jgi:hypothetical protein
MNILKKFVLATITMLCCHASFAELNGAPGTNPNQSFWVIPLNNQNVGTCQQQLFNYPDKDSYPIILIYTTADGHEFSDVFMPTYEYVALLLHKTRTFYKYDAGTANPIVTSECLGLNGAIVMPTVNVVMKIVEPELLTNPMRAIGGTKWSESKSQAVSISPAELISAITLPFPTTKNVPPTQKVLITNKPQKK